MTPEPDELIPTKEELAARSADFRWPPSPGLSAPSPSVQPSRQAFRAAPSHAPVPAPAPDSPSTSPWSFIERTWLDLIAPPLPQRMAQLGWAPDAPEAYCHRCAATVGPYEASAEGCPACSSKRLPWARAVRLGEYRPPLSLFIQEVKFTQWRRLGRELGNLLAASVAPALESAGRDPAKLLVVPVPTTFWRRMSRGIDHTHILGAAVARRLRAPHRQPLRRRHRPSQLDVPPSQRQANVSGAFRLARPRALARIAAAGPGATVLVVDDVTTTGATLRATCTALGRAFRERPVSERPNIWVAVAAWTPPAGPTRRSPPGTPPGAPTTPDRGVPAGAVWT